MKSQKGITGSWTKYGGTRNNLVMSPVQGIWTCQSCGSRMAKNMSPIMHYVEHLQIYIRICGECYRDNCKVLYNRIKNTT